MNDERIEKIDRLLDGVFTNLDDSNLTADRATKLVSLAQQLFALKREMGAEADDDADIERQMRKFNEE